MEKEKNKVEEIKRNENEILKEGKVAQQQISLEKEKSEEKKVEEEGKNKPFNFDRQRRGERRTGKEFIPSPLKKEVLATKRPVKVTKGGRRFSFTALLLVKDENKKSVAFANAGGKEMMTAFRKSSHEAQKKLTNYFSPQSTIPRDIKLRYRGVTILLKPAPPGTGVKAGSVLNSLFKFLEIKNISATIICSRRKRKNKPVIIRAAFMALDKLTGKKYNY